MSRNTGTVASGEGPGRLLGTLPVDTGGAAMGRTRRKVLHGAAGALEASGAETATGETARIAVPLGAVAIGVEVEDDILAVGGRRRGDGRADVR